MSNPVISVVSGTHNRLSYLKRMVQSARDGIGVGISYEFVVVDAGSTDGTPEWCATQPDIVFVQQGERLGAIKAFGAGAEAARGDFVVLSNDDVIYLGDGLMRALAYLESNPTTGIAAFADDRDAPDKVVESDGFGWQTMICQNGWSLYAQIGMVRRWLGDLVGWWGHDDPIMRQGSTYGGDGYLSMRVAEFGYSVDGVPGCRVHDEIARDDLREHNHREEAKNPAVLYKRYPNGPLLAPKPLIPNRQQDRLRNLYLPIFEPGTHHAVQRRHKRGLREALAETGLVWEIDYVEQSLARAFDLPALVEAWKPDVLFLQLHSAMEVTPKILAEARRRAPGMLVLNWNGDVYARHLLEPGMIDVLKLVDAQLCVNASVLPRYQAHGIPAAYWQCGWEPVDAPLPDMSSHDVLLLANNYSTARNNLGAVLKSLPVNLGLYGSGWGMDTANTTYDFPAGAALIQNAKIVIGDNQWPDETAFVSNRVFETLAHGGFLIHQYVEGMEAWLGLKDVEHYIAYSHVEELPQLVAYWLDPKHDKQRRRIAAQGQREALERHSFSARLDELFYAILPKVLKEKEAEHV